MWYSRINIAISKEEAEQIIQQELSSKTFVDPATDDENLIKQKLIEKYGSEENMVSAINQEVAEIMSEFDKSSPWTRGSNETNLYFSTPNEAFYVLPNGSTTPNLRSHVTFDKYLLSRLGINPEFLKDRSDRHILSELTGAMRIRSDNGVVTATIYTNPTADQLQWLKQNDISRNELDIRRGAEVEYGESNSDQYTETLSNLSDMGIREFYDKLDRIREYLRTIIGSVETSYDERYRPINKAANPNNLPQDQVEKLTTIYVNLNDAEAALFNVTEMLSDR